jgi:hypothetical protein
MAIMFWRIVMADVFQCTFYTILYIRNKDTKSNMAENGSVTIFGYINCCKILSDSLKKFGWNLIVLSNEPDIITEQEPCLTVCNVNFELDIPENIKFFSAHHKIDVFRHLSLYGDTYSILLDSDVVCINSMPENMGLIIKNGMPMYYDITDQCYPAYGRRKIMDDKTAVMGFESIGNWAGGEFIGGSNQFFAGIYQCCISYWNTYIAKTGLLHHQGDEMLTSCSIEKYFLEGNRIFNVGSIGGIGRYWSIKTLHIGKPFEALLDNFLLHLPADKDFLAKYKYNDGNNFLKDYQRYKENKNKKKIIELIKRCIKKITAVR